MNFILIEDNDSRPTLEQAEAEAVRRVRAGAPLQRITSPFDPRETITTVSMEGGEVKTERSERWKHGDCPTC